MMKYIEKDQKGNSDLIVDLISFREKVKEHKSHSTRLLP